MTWVVSSAFFLRPGIANPALGAHAAGKFFVVRIAMPGMMRFEGARRDFFGEKGTHARAQCLAFRRKAYLVETENGAHASIRSAGGNERPEFVGAARRDTVAERGGPVALIAEVVAPSEHAQRVTVQ